MSIQTIKCSMVRPIAYFWSLPRWFALPAAVISVALGGVIGNVSLMDLVLVCAAASCLMAGAHSYNSWADWLNGLDQGTDEERSHTKPYTGGQNLIARKIITHHEVLLVTFLWLLVSVVLTMPLAMAHTQWVWLPCGLTAICAPLYSWGKMHYSCETVLALGFGPLAAAFGSLAAPGPAMAWAFLAAIPAGLVFGVVAETIDQHIDADVNWPKGLRNIGALTWRYQWDLTLVITALLGLVAISHIILAITGVLTIRTLFALLSLPGIVLLTRAMERGYSKAIMTGLVLVFLYPLIILILEALK